MSATAPTIEIETVSQPPARPAPPYASPDYLHIDRAVALIDLATDAPATGVPSAETSRSPERPTSGPIVLELDEDGVFVLRDITGAVYGAGPSASEARAEFDAALDDHLAFLREHMDQLSAQLRLQLSALQKLFPGR
jgi:hypothetical protein